MGRAKGKDWEDVAWSQTATPASPWLVPVRCGVRTPLQDPFLGSKAFPFQPRHHHPRGRWAQIVSNGPLSSDLARKLQTQNLAGVHVSPSPTCPPLRQTTDLPTHLKLQTKSLNLGLSLGS